MTTGRGRTLRVGGLAPFSPGDWPGRLAAVVFVQGCAWRCSGCHNPHLQPREAAAAMPWQAVIDWLGSRVGLLDAVVFSGGEPTVDPALGDAVAQVRGLGFQVGLHTAGLAPRRLVRLLPSIDWVGLDVKAPLSQGALHEAITGAREGAAAVRRSLAAVVDAAAIDEVAFECRTTAHPAQLDDDALLAIADELAAAGVAAWAVQVARVPPGHRLPPVPADWPSPVLLARLRERVPAMVLRRG